MRQEKIKEHPDWKWRSKTAFIYRLCKYRYVENLMESTKEATKIREFNKVADKNQCTKFNYSPIYTSNQQSEIEIFKPLTIASKIWNT